MFMAIVGANLPGIHLAEWRSALLGISEGVSRGLNEWERDSLNVCVTVWAGSPNDRAKGENWWALAFLSLPPVHRNGKRPCPLHSPSVVMATVVVLWSRARTTRLHPLFCLLNFFLFLTGWKYLWTHCYLLKLMSPTHWCNLHALHCSLTLSKQRTGDKSMYNFRWKGLYLVETNRHDNYFHVVSQMVRVLSGETRGAGKKRAAVAGNHGCNQI